MHVLHTWHLDGHTNLPYCSSPLRPLVCPSALQDQLHLKLEQLCFQNEQASLDRCQAVFLELAEELEEKIHKGCYSVPGGYQQFMDDREKVMEKFRRAPDKGVMVRQSATL